MKKEINVPEKLEGGAVTGERASTPTMPLNLLAYFLSSYLGKRLKSQLEILPTDVMSTELLKLRAADNDAEFFQKLIK